MHSTDQITRANEARRLAQLPDEALLTRQELAVLWGCHVKTVARWVKRGVMPVVQIGPAGRPRFLMASVRSLKPR